MVEIKTLDEIKAIVEMELRQKPSCGDARVYVIEITDERVSFDWDVPTFNVGACHDAELCKSHLREIVPRLQDQYRVRRED